MCIYVVYFVKRKKRSIATMRRFNKFAICFVLKAEARLTLHEERSTFTFDSSPAMGGVRARSLRRSGPTAARNLSPTWTVGVTWLMLILFYWDRRWIYSSWIEEY